MMIQKNISKLKFKTDTGLGKRAKIGIIVLQTDQTLEHEFRKLLNFEGIAIFHSRITNEMKITKETLSKMETELPIAASLLSPFFNFDVIGYGCTSGTTIIGEKNVEKAIQIVHPNVPTSNPLTACKAALLALRIKRIAFITPYEPEITEAMRENLLDAGFEIPITGSFFESDDFVVGRIDMESILGAIIKIGTRDDCDGVFVSCTNLRVAEIIKVAEDRIGKPVTSSNHALAWHLLRLTGVKDCHKNFGSLFQRQLNG